MILQSLANYYDVLCADPESTISRPGWSSAKVVGALCIDAQGQLVDFQPLSDTVELGKKTVTRPKAMSVPQQQKRSVNVCPNLLCDFASYLLGVDDKGKPERALACFAASRQAHHALLDGVDSPIARAILAYFDQWDPAAALQHPVLAQYSKAITGGGNLIFRCGLTNAQDDPAIRQAWQACCDDTAQGEGSICLVTGRRAPMARLHPSIKGVQGAQSSGASLVCFNSPAESSHGKEQGANSPVSEAAAQAYTTALNHLIQDKAHTQHLGDTTVVFWAENGLPLYQDVISAAMFGQQYASLSDRDLDRIMTLLSRGICAELEEDTLDPDTPFFVLGLAPNAARLSVRFFWRGSFGSLLKNVKAHKDRLEIVRPSYDTRPQLSIWQLLSETVNQKSRDKNPAPLLAGATLRAILNDSPYPEELRQAVMLRIRAEREISRGRAALLKAYLLKRTSVTGALDKQCKEVLTVQLNEQSDYLPYLLGRYFALLEYIQKCANPNLNTTIKDRFFNSACATPSAVFPTLGKLHNSHIRVLKRERAGQAVNLEKQVIALHGKIQENYPVHLTLDEQGAFIIGYYHQVQELYTKKEDNNNG